MVQITTIDKGHGSTIHMLPVQELDELDFENSTNTRKKKIQIT